MMAVFSARLRLTALVATQSPPSAEFSQGSTPKAASSAGITRAAPAAQASGTSR